MTRKPGQASAAAGLDVPELLTASHIRPWALCATDAERLDVNNGLLLVAHLDRAFDRLLMTIGLYGDVRWSSKLSESQRQALGVFGKPLRLEIITDQMQTYLDWHRTQFETRMSRG